MDCIGVTKSQAQLSDFHFHFLSGDFSGKELSPASAGDLSPIPELGRSPGGGNGNPLQYSYLGSLMDRGAWQVTHLGVSKSWTRLRD